MHGRCGALTPNLASPLPALHLPAGIYSLLDQGRAFDSPAELLKAVGLYDLTQQSMVGRPRSCRLGCGPAAGCKGVLMSIANCPHLRLAASV